MVFLSGGWVVTACFNPALVSALSMGLNYQIKKSESLWFWSDQLLKLYVRPNVSINWLTQGRHIIINSWSKFCLSLDNLSSGANDPPVLIALADMVLIDQNSTDDNKR